MNQTYYQLLNCVPKHDFKTSALRKTHNGSLPGHPEGSIKASNFYTGENAAQLRDTGQPAQLTGLVAEPGRLRLPWLQSLCPLPQCGTASQNEGS